MRFADFRARARVWEWTPFAILLAAMLSWLAMGMDRDYFYRPLSHSSESAVNLAPAENLSPSRSFLLFRRMYLREDGATGYGVYGRAPIGGYALIRLAALPFGDDLAAKILAARALMLAMFGGAALLFYMALVRLLANRWAALGAAALAFSGNYTLYYSDMILTFGVMSVFGIALTFHGMAVFVRDGRFAQLALKASAAVLLDWKALALLLPFALFGAVGDAIRAAREDASRTADGARAPNAINRARSALFAAARSRHAAVGAIAVAVGIAALGFNLVNEYAALNGETPPSELPTVKSITGRLSPAGESTWAQFLRIELYRAGTAHMSLALPGYGDGLTRPGNWWGGWTVAAGAGALVACAIALFWARNRAPILVWLALSVFVADIILRHHIVSHNYAAVFHFAPPLALFSLAIVYAGEKFGERVSVGIALAAVAAFMLCAFQLNAVSHGEDAAEKAILEDHQAMREMARGKVVYLHPSISANRSAGFPNQTPFYLSDSTFIDFNHDVIIWDDAMQPRVDAADFVLTRGRLEGVESLTPNNREAFLYDSRAVADALAAEYARIVSSGEPAARGVFYVYADGGALIYAKRPCAADDTRARFFLHLYAADFYDLPPERRFHGFDGFDFPFGGYGTIFGDACMARVEMPDYAVSKIDTGQFISGGERLWSVEARFDVDTDGHFRKAYERAALAEPTARSVFDLHLTDGALIYVKRPCSENDARGRFLLSAFPSDDGDLEDGREEIGHNSLNFSFAEYGGIVDGRCVIRRPLPDYALERLEIGQWIPGGDTLWKTEISMRD